MRIFCRGAILALWAGWMAFSLHAEGWIAFTDREDNPLIIEYLRSADLAESLQAVEDIGRRADPYISDILSALQGSHRQQLLLRSLLRAAFPPESPGEELDRRLAANQEGLELLARGMEGYELPLRRESVRVLRARGAGEFDRYVLGQADWCVRLLQEQEGLTDAEQSAFLLEILEYAGSRRNAVFLDPVLRILEATRNRAVAQKAFKIARVLASIRTASRNREEWSPAPN
jgi:hypothetical protein